MRRADTPPSFRPTPLDKPQTGPKVCGLRSAGGRSWRRFGLAAVLALLGALCLFPTSTGAQTFSEYLSTTTPVRRRA